MTSSKMRIMNTLVPLAIAIAAASAAAEPLAGVDPRVYLRARKPVPEVVRELKHAKVDTAIRILTGDVSGLLAGDDAYPQAMKVDERQQLRFLERRALVIGAIHSIAFHKPPGALSLIQGQLTSPDSTIRAEAADQLGELGEPAIDSLSQAANHDSDIRVREAACVGLGRVHSDHAIIALTPFVLDSKDFDRQRAALRALANIGSPWAWAAKRDENGGARVRSKALALLTHVERKGAIVPILEDAERQLNR